MKFRVLWIDPTGEGRFTTIEASSSEAAAWEAARLAFIVTDGQTSAFEAIERIDKPAGRSRT